MVLAYLRECAISNNWNANRNERLLSVITQKCDVQSPGSRFLSVTYCLFVVIAIACFLFTNFITYLIDLRICQCKRGSGVCCMCWHAAPNLCLYCFFFLFAISFLNCVFSWPVSLSCVVRGSRVFKPSLYGFFLSILHCAMGNKASFIHSIVPTLGFGICIRPLL